VAFRLDKGSGLERSRVVILFAVVAAAVMVAAAVVVILVADQVGREYSRQRWARWHPED
jgi:hypothetical protein